jgi:DNA-binding FadR family transcriptional regulator
LVQNSEGAAMSRNLASDVAASLRHRITSGEWNNTKLLPNERDLASEYKVARNTLRRAIDAIEQEGMVSRHVGRGTIIRTESGDDLLGIMQRISGTSPLDIMNVRMIVEPQAAAAAAANASEADLTSIRDAHERASAALETAAFESWDAEFHQRIFASTRNEFLTNLHDILRVIRNRAPWTEIKRRSFSEERRASYCGDHRMILDALRSRDADGAAQAMKAHLISVNRNLFGGNGML